MRLHRSTPKSPLRLTAIESGQTNRLGKVRTLVTADRPVGVTYDRSTDNIDFHFDGVTLERVLGRAGLELDTDYPDGADLNQLWFLRSAKTDNLELDMANDLLASDTKPRVRITTETQSEYPGLIYAHRKTTIGTLAKCAVSSSPHIVGVRTVASGPPSQDTLTYTPSVMVVPGIMSMYQPNTVLAALADPGSSMKDAVKAVRFGLTL